MDAGEDRRTLLDAASSIACDDDLRWQADANGVGDGGDCCRFCCRCRRTVAIEARSGH
ncbi:hypothetical protein ACLOJK_017593 [Asimina triloba]